VPERRGAGAAFTLIELLVVIAVIALLIGLILPGLRMAREAGRQAKCLSNLRQVGISSNYYAEEKRDFIPREGYGNYGRAGWAIDLRPYIDDKIAANDTGDPRDDYNDQFVDALYYRCPSRKPDLHNLHYVVNAVPFLAPGDPDERAGRDADIRRGPTERYRIMFPAKTFYLCEFADDPSGNRGRSYYRPGATNVDIAAWYDVWDENDVIGGENLLRISPKRHTRGADVAFMDGHASLVAREVLQDLNNWDDGIYPPRP